MAAQINSPVQNRTLSQIADPAVLGFQLPQQ